jgi:predicted nucleotidyltransferase
MSQRAYILDQLQRHKDSLERDFSVDYLGLFGSVAREEDGISSDVDLLVSFSRPVGVEFLELGHHLEQLLGRKVDLVSLGGIAPKYLEAIQDDLIDVQASAPSLA